MGLIKAYQRFIYHRAAHFALPLSQCVFPILYPSRTIVAELWYEFGCLALGLVVVLACMMLGNRHDLRACTRCAGQSAAVTEKPVPPAAMGGRRRAVRAHLLSVGFGTFGNVAVAIALYFVVVHAPLPARIGGTLVSFMCAVFVAREIMRHLRTLRWCPRCEAKSIRVAQRLLWGTAKPWIHKVPRPPHRIPTKR